MRLRILIAATLALNPQLARADALRDLRASLALLAATTPVRGSLELTSTTRSSDGDRAVSGSATVGFDAGDAGLQLTYPRPLLTQASQEARGEAIDPERETPARTRTGDRLMAARYEHTRKSDGLGQHESSKTNEVLHLQP